MIPNFLIFTARASSFQKLTSPSFLSSSFLAAIFSNTSFCLFRIASMLEKSCQSCPSANICSYNCPGRKSCPKPPLLQFRLGSSRERLRKMSSEVAVLRQKMQVLLQTFLPRQLLMIYSCSTRCHWPWPFQKRLANLWRGILSISTSVSGRDYVQGFDLLGLGFWAFGLVCFAVCCASNLCPSSSGKRRAQYFLESSAIARISLDWRKGRMPNSLSFFMTQRRGSRFFIKN